MIGCWSDEEHDALKKMYSDPSCSRADMEFRFSKKWRSIVNHANNTGLVRGIDETFILEQVALGKSGSRISQEVGICTRIILKILSNHGVERSRKSYKLPAKDIISKYKDKKKSAKAIAKEYNCRSPDPIYRILNKYGVSRNSDRDYQTTLEDEQFFAEIDTEAKSYLLGLLAADGCLHKKTQRGCVTYHIKLALKDKDLIYLAAKLIGWHGAIGHYPARWVTICGNKCWCKPTWLFSICSRRMFFDLKKHGVDETKSRNLSFPSITDDIKSHFIRGFFDGDGCITFSHDSTNWINGRPSFSIIGLEIILLEIQEELIRHCEISKTKLVKEKRVKHPLFNLRYNGKYALLIRDYIYDDATVFLQRKYDRFFSVELPKNYRDNNVKR